MSEIDPIAEALARCAALPLEAALQLFEKYGRPLADEVLAGLALEPVVELAPGVRVGRLRFRAPVDVLANDHFVLLRPEEEARAMPGPLFASAIAALTRRHGPDSADG